MDPRLMRRTFIAGLLAGLRVLWPIFSALLAAMAGLGVVVGMLEGWSLQESIYFAFVSDDRLWRSGGQDAARPLARDPHRSVRSAVYRTAGCRRCQGAAHAE
jgi:hypothetical protein